MKRVIRSCSIWSRLSRSPAAIIPALALLSAVACSPGSPGAAVDGVRHVALLELANPSRFARPDEAVTLSFNELGVEAAQLQSGRLVARSAGQVLPGQSIDTDGDSQEDSFLFLVDLPPAGKREVQIGFGRPDETGVKRTQAEISVKAGGRWEGRRYVGGEFVNVKHLVPPEQHTDHSEFIRYEGPGIESDKVGYRIYLDWRNGFDIFGKKTPGMVLQDIGRDGYESYHRMADWGMDILKVGDSLGMGSFGYWDGEKVERVSKVDGWEAAVVEDGDIYSALQIDYKGWEVAGKKLDVQADLSMTAGSRLVHTRLKLSEELPNVAVGLVDHEGTEFLTGEIVVTGGPYTYVATYGQQSLSGDNLGMALVFPDRLGERQSQVTDSHNHVSVMKPSAEMVEYYFLAAWESEPGGIKSKEEFVAYLERELERLAMPARQRLTTAHSESAKSFPVTAGQALAWSKKLADAELERKALSYAHGRWDKMRHRESKWSYTTGLLMQAYDDYTQIDPVPRYDAAVREVLGSYITPDGEILTYEPEKYNIDHINSGKMLLRLYEKTGDEKYRIAAGHLREQLEHHPRTSEGAFWHKQRYPYQLWLDGVYMGMPFLAHYSRLFEQGASLEEAVTEFRIVHERLRDPQTGLYYHAWDEKKVQEWADPQTGLSDYFWGRGMGWLAMALVDVLDYIPEDRADDRRFLIGMLGEFAAAIVQYQEQDTGVWYQIMDQPDRAGNYRESTASAMFVYTLAKGVNKGYLPGSYKEAAVKGYEGVVKEFIRVDADGRVSMTNMCMVAGLGYGRDGSYRYYMIEPVVDNDPKGTGPFIMAGVQMHELLGD